MANETHPDSNPGSIHKAKGPTWPKSEHDPLLISADGNKVGETNTVALNHVLAKLDIPGWSPTNGRQRNLEAFAAAYQKVFTDAGTAAVKAGA
jgi:hypothetical protein